MKARTIAAVFVLPLTAAATELAPGGPEVKVRTSAAQTVIEYCPDNTCERFSVPGRNVVLAKGSAVAFLYGVSDYAYLAEFQAGPPPDQLQQLLARFASIHPLRLRGLVRARAARVHLVHCSESACG